MATVSAVAGVGAPAAAFQFENGTIWPLTVGINGGPAQVVPPEEVTFLFRGQCPNGCQLNITIADPSRAGTVISGAGGQPAAILGNGDPVIVRVRQDRGGISVEVAGDTSVGAYTAPTGTPATGGVLVPPGGTLPQQPQPATQQSVPPVAPSPQSTVPALTAPPIETPPATTPVPPPATTPATTTPAPTQSGPAGFVPPPPPPEYSN